MRSSDNGGAVPKLSRNLLKGIFANFPDILALSRAMHSAFETPQDSTGFSPCSDVVDKILPLLPFLRQYTLLVSNFAQSSALLRDLRREDADTPPLEPEQRRRWQAFVNAQECTDDVPSLAGLSLESLLLNIVQRVPRYRLLLVDIVLFSDPADPSVHKWKRALTLVEKSAQFSTCTRTGHATLTEPRLTVADHLEAHIQLHDKALILLDLQQRFDNLSTPLVQPSRRLLRREVFEIVVRGRNEGRMALLLLSDALLLARILRSDRGFAGSVFSRHDIRFELYAQLDLSAITVTAGSRASRWTGEPTIEVFGRELSFSLIART